MATHHGSSRVARMLLLAATVLTTTACGTLDAAGDDDDHSAGAMSVDVVVESDAATAANVRVDLDAREDPQLVDEAAAALPYEQTFEVQLDVPFPLSGARVEATAADDATWVSCTVTLDGDVVAEQRQDGAGSVATCESELRLGPS